MKKLLLVLCMLTCIFTMSACSTLESSDSQIDQSIEATMKEDVTAMFEMFYTSDEATLAMYYEQVIAAKDTVFIHAFDNWMSVKEELGSYVSTDGIQVTQAQDGYMASLSATFEKRSVTFSIIIDEGYTKYTSIQFEPQYSMGEKMQKAALNTVLGMSTVFAVLILIIGVISSFKYINKFENKNKQAKANQTSEQPGSGSAADSEFSVVSENFENLTDDLELVAVITAAIAAASGAQADGLVVRSIRRAQNSKWKDAR